MPQGRIDARNSASVLSDTNMQPPFYISCDMAININTPLVSHTQNNIGIGEEQKIILQAKGSHAPRRLICLALKRTNGEVT